MSVEFPYPWSTGPPGWTCQTCDSWVPNGCTHSCPTAVRWVNQPVQVPTDLERIAAALERIAAALEASA